jgi:1-acyl-sn-glycerol-3-phosphate acyltransferase
MANQPHPKRLIVAENTAKLMLPLLQKYHRAKFIGLENIPDKSFLGVGNHLGVYFMPESFLWIGKYHTLKGKPPMKVLVHHVFHKIAKVLNLPEDEFGIVDANPHYAINELKNGNALTVYPGGDQDNTKPFCDRNKIEFYNHFGYIKLAIKAGVPILPIVGIGGGETLFVLTSGHQFTERSKLAQRLKLKSWPIYWSFPFGWHIGHGPRFSLPLPAQVTISILPAICLDAYTLEDIKDESVLHKINKMIEATMQTELDKLAKNRIPVIGKLD